MIQVTERAARELQDMLGDGQRGLRLMISKGGCAGLQYGMTIDDRKEGDTVVRTSGGALFIDEESLPFLRGSVVDFSDALQDTGFKIINPNAARTCGCGTSFEIGKEGDNPGEGAS